MDGFRMLLIPSPPYYASPQTGDEFKAIGTGGKRVVGRVGEIVAAYGKQSQGTKQINVAIQEMDKAIQQNAVNTDEASLASQGSNVNVLQMRYLLFLCFLVQRTARYTYRTAESGW
jgi:hypothetical protein